jgi:3alpha(or 20beta)-hydroxysteroid dehydrogenase
MFWDFPTNKSPAWKNLMQSDSPSSAKHRRVFDANCLHGKIALVTGAAGGIGAEITQSLQAADAVVIAADLSQPSIDGKLIETTALDVASANDWTAAVNNIIEGHGQLDILVNCAGIFKPCPIDAETPEGFTKTFEVNQLGVFLGMQAVFPAMKENGGSIINLSSAAGLFGNPATISYSATKWAVRGMTKVAALEYAPYNIRVNSIHPGPIRTRMVTSIPGAKETAGKSSPLGRIGEPEEVAALTVFLASDASSYSTGSEFICDGGLNAQ